MDAETLISLYKKVVLIRHVEEAIVEYYKEQEMRCPVHLCIGQEAIAAGVCQCLDKEDLVLSNHRSHGHYLAKGGNLRAMIAELYGKSTGCAGGRGGSMHVIDLDAGLLGATSIVGGTIPLAVGSALSTVMQGKKNISTVFLGDGATEEGVFHESLNYAALKKLPVLFVCEHNSYAVNTHVRERQASRKIHDIASSHSLDTYHGDGNDALEVYKIAKKAIDSIRAGNGPVLLEFDTYRMMQHCGMIYDHVIGCRPEEEFMEWKKKCPKDTFEKQLLQQGILTREDIAAIAEDIDAEIKDAFDFAKKSPFPEASTLSRNIYSE